MEISAIINYKNKIINGGIILLAVIIGYNLYSGQAKTVDSLKGNKETELKRNEILNGISTSENQISKYKNFVNKKDVSSLINSLATLANNAKVKITSVKPLGVIDFPVYTKSQFQLQINALNFAVLGKFISDLENSDDIYTVDAITIFPVSASAERPEVESNQKEKLSAEMKVSTILFK